MEGGSPRRNITGASGEGVLAERDVARYTSDDPLVLVHGRREEHQAWDSSQVESGASEGRVMTTITPSASVVDLDDEVPRHRDVGGSKAAVLARP